MSRPAISLRRSILVSFVSLVVLAACHDNGSDGGAPAASIDHLALPEYWPTSSWQSASPQSHGFQRGAFDTLDDDIAAELPYLTSLMIVRDGYVLYEQYQKPLIVAGDVDENTIHNLWSVTKSVTSLTLGAAVQQNDLAMTDLQTTVDDVFSSLITDLPLDDARRQIRLLDTLQMQSGLAWNEQKDLISLRNPLLFPNSSCVDDDTALLCSILHFSFSHAPGTVWNYNTNDSYLTGAFFYALTSWSLRDYADQYLFVPMGISFVEDQWINAPNSETNSAYTYGGGLLGLTTRDLAKLGMLALYDGVWDGQQLVSQDWLALSRTPIGNGLVATFLGDGSETTPTNDDIAYGLQWWLASGPGFDGLEALSARGLGGQYILVFGDSGVVIALTCAYSLGQNTDGRGEEVANFIQTHVLDKISD